MKEGSGIRVYTPKAARVGLGHKEIAAEIIAALMWGAKTRKDLHRITGASTQLILQWLKALKASGVVYLAGYTNGSATFALQETPFDKPDARPRSRSRAVRTVSGFRVPEVRAASMGVNHG